MPRQGRALERLIHAIEDSVKENENVKVESPKYLPQRGRKGKREHDVVITTHEGHHKILIALECRDRTARCGRPDVEAFAKKCQNTGIHRACIVSKSGFTDSALEEASLQNIECYLLSEVEKIDWLRLGGIRKHVNKFVQSYWTFLAPRGERLNTEDWEVVTDEGEEPNPDKLNEMAWELFKGFNKSSDQEEGEYQLKYAFPCEGFILRNRETDEELNCDKVGITFTYRVEKGFLPFTKYRYSSTASDDTIAEVAEASIESPEVKGRVVLTGTSDGGVTIAFISD